MSERFWAVVLAGGEGSRLAKSAIEMHGSLLPKQFLSFGQERTLLQATVERLSPTIPYDRVVVVVPRCHEDLARAQLRAHRGVEIVAQPRNLGTGPGVLLPLAHVLRRDPDANVALVPSDHSFRRPQCMLDALSRAERVVDDRPVGMVLLGAKADSAARDLGWIVAEPRHDGQAVAGIRRFVEKPSQPVADALFAEGAWWNTMLTVARGESLWRLARHHLSQQADLLGHYRPEIGRTGERERLDDVYARMRPADFCADLIAESRGLSAIALGDAGWTDCGTPERLASALRRGTSRLPSSASSPRARAAGAV